MEEVLVGVFMASPKDRAQQRLVVQQTSTFPVPHGRGGRARGSLHGLSQGQGSADCADFVVYPASHGRGGGARGGFHGMSQGQGSTPFCEAEHVDISAPHGRGKLGDGVFSSSSAGAADEDPAVRGSGMGKAGSTGYDAPCGSSSRGKAGSTGDDAPRVPLGARSGVGRQRPRPGQGSTALCGRRFVGQVFVEPAAAGRVGFLESVSAQAELAFGGDFRFSASCRGRVADGDYVWFSARQLPARRWEAFDLVHF